LLDGKGKEDGEPTSSSEFALDGESAPELSRQSLYDRQSQAEAFAAISFTVVNLRKIIEDCGLMFKRNPFAGIFQGRRLDCGWEIPYKRVF